MRKPRAYIYPFDNESVHFFRFMDQNTSFDIVGAVSPNGWGLTGKDVGIIDGGEEIGIFVENSFNSTDAFDTLLLVDSFSELDFDKIILKNIKDLVQKNINIVCYRDLQPEQIQQISNLCDQHQVKFEGCKKYDDNKTVIQESIEKVNVPVVFVVGISDRTNKFDIQLSLRRDFKDMGYKVSQIGTKKHCEVFGFHSFPELMFSKKFSEAEKVVLFNRFIKEIEENEDPDVIVIGVPGGTMAINDIFTNKFGIMAYLVSQAVKPDAAIFTTYYGDYKEEYFDELNKMFKYRYGYALDCVNLSCVKFDSKESETHQKKCYIVLNSNHLEQRRKAYNLKSGIEKPIFNILSSENRNKLSQYIIDVLAGDGIVKDVI